MGHEDRAWAPQTAGRMAGAASAFLAGLTEPQRSLACYAFCDDRRDWSFLPGPDRSGLPIGALDDGQRRLAHELIMSGTSLPGYAKVVSVLAMEHIRRALVPTLAGLFDPERFCSSSTTTPRATATTSTRCGGTRRTISATTCWPSTTACTTPGTARRPRAAQPAPE